MHTRLIKVARGRRIVVRPLRRGDADTVVAVFDQLGEQSRRRRFHGPKSHLDEEELRSLSAVDGRHHVLVAYVEGNPRPVAIARLVRSGRSAEIAIEVADAHQRRGIGAALARELIADATAAGITEVTALVSSENQAAVALLRRIPSALEIRFEGPELSIRAALPRGSVTSEARAEPYPLA